MRRQFVYVFLIIVSVITLQFLPPEFVFHNFVEGRAQATDITDLTGTTGKLGQEDISFGSGQDTDTFTVTGYSGATVTLTKLPSLAANVASIIKGVWYVEATAGDHCDSSLEGSVAWVINELGSDPATIELPGNQTYQCSTSYEIPSTISVDYQMGAKWTVDNTVTLTHSGLIKAGKQQIFTGSGSIAYPDGIVVQSSWDDDFQTIVSDISTSKVNLEVSDAEVITDGTTVTINANTGLHILPGGSIDGVAGGGTETLTINGYLDINTTNTVFGSNLTTSVSIEGSGIAVGYASGLSVLQGLTPVNGTTVYLKYRTTEGDGGHGMFVFDNSDYSTEVALEEVTSGQGDGGIHIAPASDKTGSSGAWVRQYTGGVIPEWFGSVDGTADDVQIQAAIDANPTGTVLLLNKTYMLASSIVPTSGQIITGTSMSGTKLSAPGITAIKTAASSQVLIQNMTIDSNDTATTYGIWLYRCSRSAIRNVAITDFGTANDGAGIFIDGDGENASWAIELSTVEVSSCGRGIYAYDSQDLTLVNFISRLNIGYAGHFNDIYGLSIVGGAFEYSDSATTPNGWNLVINNVRHGFITSFFENARDGHIWIKDSKLITVTNSRVQAYSGNTMAFGWIYLNNSDLCKITNNDINGLDGNFTNKAEIHIDATSDFNVVEGNDLEYDGTISTNYHVVNLGTNNILINNIGHQNSDANIGPVSILWGTTTTQASGITTGIIGTFVDGDTTPDVGIQMDSSFLTANTGATAITDFDHGSVGIDGVRAYEGQKISIVFGDAVTTLTNGATLILNNGANWTPAVGDTWKGEYSNKIWYETGRSDNTP